MTSKIRNRRLSLLKNWRIKKNTRNNGEVFYVVQWKAWFGLWVYEWDGDEENTESEAKAYVVNSIASNASRYDKKCGRKIAKKEIINFKQI